MFIVFYSTLNKILSYLILSYLILEDIHVRTWASFDDPPTTAFIPILCYHIDLLSMLYKAVTVRLVSIYLTDELMDKNDIDKFVTALRLSLDECSVKAIIHY